MDRIGLLDQMRDNWPGRIEEPRIRLLERKTREFTKDEIELAVDTMLEECTYPPTVKDAVAACRKARTSLRHRKERDARDKKFQPGDVVDGQRTLTPRQAMAELARMRKEHPEAFREGPVPACNPADREKSRKRFEMMGHRIYVAGLRKCVSWDRELSLSGDLASQKEMF